MLYLFITPEIDYPEEMPLPGIPSLLGMLKSKNIRCEYININSEFINYLDNKKINIYIDDLFYLYNEKKYLKFPTFYKKYFSNKKEINMKYINYLKKNISNFQVFKEKRKKRKEMYNYINYTFYLNFITSIKNSSLFNPLPIYYINEINFDINIEDILFIYNNISFVYRNFYEEKIEQIINKKPDIIGIQITSDKFAISGLILAYKIKQKRPNIHINIGGYFFEEYYKRINNLRNFFGIFFDSISIGESTTTVCDLIKYLNKEISIDKVTNILYLREEKLIFNKSKKQEKLDELPFQSFDGYNPDDYSLPEFVLPVRASLTKSCYWGNCIYCACSYNNKKSYRIMNVKRFVEEIEYLSKKYRTNYFAFWDNALPPTYLSKVADSLIKKNLNIKYSIYLRLDKKFDYNLLKKIKNSGCIAIHWGLDSASQRVCDYINKGINLEKAEKILENSKKIGIINILYLIFGFPTETIPEIEESLLFYIKNQKNINEIFTINKILFLENSILYKNYKYYKNLINFSEEFENRKKEIIEKINNINRNLEDSAMYSQWQYLYIVKYGKFKYYLIKNLRYYYFKSRNKLIKKIYKYILKNFF